MKRYTVGKVPSINELRFTMNVLKREGAGERRSASQDTQLTDDSVQPFESKGGLGMWSGNRYRSVVFSVCAFLSLPIIGSTLAFGEEASDAEPVLETREVIISATKAEIPVKQVTSAVEVITGDQMQQRKLKTVVEALRWAQGLSVNSKRRTWYGSRRADARGTPEQTLVMIDGAIVNSAYDRQLRFREFDDRQYRPD